MGGGDGVADQLSSRAWSGFLSVKADLDARVDDGVGATDQRPAWVLAGFLSVTGGGLDPLVARVGLSGCGFGPRERVCGPVVAENADDVVVMYASRIAEKTDVRTIFDRPLHPYTQGLLRSLPKLEEQKERLEVIPGTVPDPLHFPSGCKFHPRCPMGCNDKRCQTVEPELKEVTAGHKVACWHAPGYEEK